VEHVALTEKLRGVRKILVEKFEGCCLGDPSIHGRVVFGCMLYEWAVRVWAGLICVGSSSILAWLCDCQMLIVLVLVCRLTSCTWLWTIRFKTAQNFPLVT